MARMTAFQTQVMARGLANIAIEAHKATPNMFLIRMISEHLRTEFTAILAQDIEIEPPAPLPPCVAGGAQA